MIDQLKKLAGGIADVVLLRPPRDYPKRKITPNPPPWDVPLDQTTGPIDLESDAKL